LLGQVFNGVSSIVLRFGKNWIKIFIPAVLRKVRNDWVQENDLSLQESHESEGISFSTLGNKVILLDRLELEESVFKALLVFHLIIVESGLLNSVVDSVFENVIPEIKRFFGFSEIDLAIWNGGFDVVLHPLLKNEKLQNRGISNISLEVGIIKTISSIS